MRKFFLMTTALLLSFSLSPVLRAEDVSGSGTGLSIIPRFDIQPSVSTDGEGTGGFSFGNSSLYTMFEAQMNGHWSFLLVNHWLSNDSSLSNMFAGTNSLYESTFRSDSFSWVDYLNVTCTAGGFSFTLGKDVLTTGGFEYDPWDFETHPAMMSGLYNNLPAYQWGGKAAWTTPSESTTIGLQVTTSPYSCGEDDRSSRPFAAGRYNYSLSWLGDYGIFHTNASITALQRYDFSYSWLAAAGIRLTPGAFTVDFNWFNKVGRGADDFLAKGNTGTASVTYTTPSDRFEFTLKGILEKVSDPDDDLYDDWITGISAHWYPLKESRDLRVHATVTYEDAFPGCYFSLGVLYNLYIPFGHRTR